MTARTPLGFYPAVFLPSMATFGVFGRAGGHLGEKKAGPSDQQWPPIILTVPASAAASRPRRSIVPALHPGGLLGRAFFRLRFLQVGVFAVLRRMIFPQPWGTRG
jgi:hypothetical protein